MQINWIAENDTIKSIEANKPSLATVYQFGIPSFQFKTGYFCVAYLENVQTKFLTRRVQIDTCTWKQCNRLSKLLCWVLTVRLIKNLLKFFR